MSALVHIARHPAASPELRAHIVKHVGAAAEPSDPPKTRRRPPPGDLTVAWLRHWARTDRAGAARWAAARIADAGDDDTLAGRLRDLYRTGAPGTLAWFTSLSTSTNDVGRWASRHRGRHDRQLRAWHTAVEHHPHPRIVTAALRCTYRGEALNDKHQLLRLILATDEAPVASRTAALYDLIQDHVDLPTLPDPAMESYLRVAPWPVVTFLASYNRLAYVLAALERPDIPSEAFERLAELGARAVTSSGSGTVMRFAWTMLTHPLASRAHHVSAGGSLVWAAAHPPELFPAVAGQASTAAARRMTDEPWAAVAGDLPVDALDALVEWCGPGFAAVLDATLRTHLPRITTAAQAQAFTSPELRIGTVNDWFTIAAAVGD